jgi:hypothetical protein
MDTSIVRHDYNGLAIPQRAEDGYVNLTAMAQSFGKKVNDFLRLKQKKAYISALSRAGGIPADTIVVMNGSEFPNELRGTWAHPDVSIKFAAWLSPDFEVWAMQTLRQIINGDIPIPHISQLLPTLVLPAPKAWTERFGAEWRAEAERLTGWSWNARCMHRFINRCTYDWFPIEVQEELDRVNPCIQGNRRNRQHQHLKGEAADILDRQIDRTLQLMIASSSLQQFEQMLDQAMTRRYQLSLKMA